MATIAGRPAATSARAPATPSHERNVVRWTGAIGVWAALILVAGFPLNFVMGTPPAVSDADKYADYLTKVNGLVLATKLIDTLYVAGFVVFLVGVRDLIRGCGAKYEWAATLAFGAGVHRLAAGRRGCMFRATPSEATARAEV